MSIPQVIPPPPSSPCGTCCGIRNTRHAHRDGLLTTSSPHAPAPHLYCLHLLTRRRPCCLLSATSPSDVPRRRRLLPGPVCRRPPDLSSPPRVVVAALGTEDAPCRRRTSLRRLGRRPPCDLLLAPSPLPDSEPQALPTTVLPLGNPTPTAPNTTAAKDNLTTSGCSTMGETDPQVPLLFSSSRVFIALLLRIATGKASARCTECTASSWPTLLPARRPNRAPHGQQLHRHRHRSHLLRRCS